MIKCSCGEITTKDISDIKKGSSTRCMKCAHPSLRKEMIGQKFGSYTVISYDPTKKPGRHYKCLCECGNVVIKAGTELRAGRASKCIDCKNKNIFNPEKEIGNKYGKWTVVAFAGKRHGKYKQFLCACDCGTTKIHVIAELKKGTSKQCKACNNIQRAHEIKQYDVADTHVYKMWSSIKVRCSNQYVHHYNRCKKNGIKMCDRWLKFENFIADMGMPPKNMIIKRIHSDGNYEPSNCTWISYKENCLNRSYAKTRPSTKKQRKVKNG